MKMVEGAHAELQLWLDIESTLAMLGGGEVLISGVEEGYPLKHFPVEFKATLQRREQLNIRTRALICQGNTFIVMRPENYRAISKELFQQTCSYVYADKVAILNPQPPFGTMIIKNRFVAETHRRQFEFNWAYGRPLDPRNVVIGKL
jgi:hypothetical protein